MELPAVDSVVEVILLCGHASHVSSLVIEVPLFLVAMQLPDAPSVSTSKKVRVSLMDLLTPMSYFITLLTNIWATAIVARKAW